jgi:SAM-dependent methyltransferase
MLEFSPEELLSNGQSINVHAFSRAQFDPTRIGSPGLVPLSGRFYPKGILKDVAGIFSVNREPFRCVEIGNGHIKADMGHPLAGRPISLNVSVGSVSSKLEERGGGLKDWIETVTTGVGMQARWMNQPTDFFEGEPFLRIDALPDRGFYAKPRLVQHLDDTALEMVRQLYGRFVKEKMRVLDLMSSWQSHLPADVGLKQVAGVGLNAYELQKNPRLTDRLVLDLNHDATLPFPDGHFDVAVCTVSVEYLINPDAVFSEVARILRSDGHFILTFSNRWFEPKAVQIWKELHEFERMGLVLEYFQRSRRFYNLQTYSLRGLVRPSHDKYFRQLPYADPVYAVWGQKA